MSSEKDFVKPDPDAKFFDSAGVELATHGLEHNEEIVKRAWRKVDFHIMPIAVLLYLASYIDRANIGNAKVLGMSKDLGLTPSQYNWSLSIFFIGYLLYETPSNIILKKVHPRWYIPILTVIWGIICSLVSLVHDSSQLLTIRFFLGVAEAGFLPGIIYWMGCWYPRPMQGRRFAVLYSAVSLTGAFGGLLATAIHSLNGKRGIAGWRWIFIVEGCITAGLGVLSFFFMCNYPDTAKWLTPAERAVILKANEADRALKAGEAFNGKQIWSAFTDYRTYLWGLIYLSTYIPVYSVILSLPTVVTGLGYKGTTATLMACPPYGFGFIVVLFAGWTSDRFKDRFTHYVIGCLVTMVALIVLMAATNLVVRYVMFFLAMFMFLPISIIWSWVANNTAGTNKRAAATGVIFSMGNIGGAISGQIYRAEWAPRYVQGHAINFGCYVFALAAGTLSWWGYRRDNQRRDREFGQRKDGNNMLGDELGDLGDRHPNFRYYT
ncbi:hypothetical protein JAAARDRAFT_193095 [Jaapia argillacea MUCL 33604]|uniref:Major facilitator superfamily (MFS) profile domain-containing protein n=1 Tax=Jaapia argillacea MUCL 33604 TaxID=933084 RepID=A0A067Q4X7_9AGAM|nr:hypothetical protein JAAARDRAFT_193095 [Jaapia argillacea MUCL 33604]